MREADRPGSSGKRAREEQEGARWKSDRWTPLGAQESCTEVHSSLSDGKNTPHLAAGDDVITAAKAGWLH